jgi:hypothetical protein
MHQRREHVCVIHAFQQTEMAGVRSIAFPVQLINLGTNPSHWFIILICDPCLPFPMFEKRVKSRKMQAPLQAQRWYPHRVVSIDAPGYIYKYAHVPSVSNRAYRKFERDRSGRFFIHNKTEKLQSDRFLKACGSTVNILDLQENLEQWETACSANANPC